MKRLRELFVNQKLNRKFTLVIISLMVVPIGVFAGIFFRIMEDNVVNQNIDYMSYTMQRNDDAIKSKIDSINMSTQFFLSDESVAQILDKAQSGESISVSKWLEFKNDSVSALERLVYNNPLLYGVRVYAENDNVQEIMPILYQKSRLDKQEWAAKEDYFGWNYDYRDNSFSSYTMNQSRRLIGLITPVYNDDGTRTGTIEAAMTMENMFPSIYENIENEWSFFYTDKGSVYLDEKKEKPDERLMQSVISNAASKDGGISTVCLKTGAKRLVVSYMPVNELHGSLISVKDITSDVYRVYTMRNVFVLLMLILLIALAFFINRIVLHLLRQFYEIMRSIREVQQGNLDVVIENCGKDEMGELGIQINKMLSRIKELMEDNLNREMLMKNSEIRALQNQINAHFIYNVLESIKMMAEINEEYDISDAVTALGKLLRYSMKWTSKNVLVEDELEYIKNYMALINLRFDYEIYLSVNMPNMLLKQEIPKLSLQPIVENAIYHGIEEIAEDTNIYLKGTIDNGDCVIEISDMGKGMTQEQVEGLRMKIAGELDSNGGSGNGIGLKNVQDRIHIAFGDKYGIQIISKLGCYTKVVVRIPVTHPNFEGGRT